VAALLALDPTLDAAGNIEPMTKAARSIQSFSVTKAVRNAKLDGRRVHAGETIVLGPDDCLLAVDRDLERAFEAALAGLRPGFELVTLYYGDGADLEEAERLARRVGELYPGTEVEVVHGGQPHYRYLVAVE
jgi:dihydroxyacetone kinase-like predicted kinase